MNAPPAGPPLRIAAAALAALRAHAEEAYPDECCGALVGVATNEGWRVEAAMRATNACATSDPASGPASGQTRYEIAPTELVKIVREARARGLEIAGFYHSHPGHPAEWSPTDLAEAHWLGCCYLITSVREGQAAETACFLLAGEREEDKRFERRAILIEA